MGFSAVILSKNNSAIVNETTVKTSAGAIYNINLCKVKHIADALVYFQAEGFESIATSEKLIKRFISTIFQRKLF